MCTARLRNPIIFYTEVYDIFMSLNYSNRKPYLMGASKTIRSIYFYLLYGYLVHLTSNEFSITKVMIYA